MLIKYFSDIHLEYGSHQLLFNLLDDNRVDVFVIAGDLCTSKYILRTLEDIDSFVNQPVVFIMGNHDYYGSSRKTIDEQLSTKKFKHIYFLNESWVCIGDILFVGATGWWDREMQPHHIFGLADFSRISDIKTSKYGTSWGRKAKYFFNTTLRSFEKAKVVCITHNAPSRRSIAPEYKYDNLNDCFANEWDELIYKYQPSVWIHGHMHGTCDYFIDKTHVMCNPYGYEGKAINNKFDNKAYLCL